jgi:tRNA nucleotidyltransferase (CCA-adding enzyme)
MTIKVEPRSFVVYRPKNSDDVVIGRIEGETKKEYIDRMIKTYSMLPVTKQYNCDKDRRQEIYIKKSRLRRGIDILIEYRLSPKPSTDFINDFVCKWEMIEMEFREMTGYKECIYTKNQQAKGKCPAIKLNLLRCTACEDL